MTVWRTCSPSCFGPQSSNSARWPAPAWSWHDHCYAPKAVWKRTSPPWSHWHWTPMWAQCLGVGRDRGFFRSRFCLEVCPISLRGLSWRLSGPPVALVTSWGPKSPNIAEEEARRASTKNLARKSAKPLSLERCGSPHYKPPTLINAAPTSVWSHRSTSKAWAEQAPLASAAT